MLSVMESCDILARSHFRPNNLSSVLPPSTVACNHKKSRCKRVISALILQDTSLIQSAKKCRLEVAGKMTEFAKN